MEELSLEEQEKQQLDYVRKQFRKIENYPQPGINFIDITPLLKDPSAVSIVVEYFIDRLHPIEFDAIVGIDSRGFLFGMTLAYKLQKPFVLVRKAGKLPADTVSEEYDLEYGSAKLEMHKDSLKPGQKALIHDDLLATGGTAMAAANLLEKVNCSVAGFFFIVELEELKGKEKLKEKGDVISMNKF